MLRQCHAFEPWFAELKAVDPTFPTALDSAIQRFASLGWVVGGAAIEALADRLKVPNEFRRLTDKVALCGPILARWHEAPATEVLRSVKRVDGFKRDDNFTDLLTVVGACADINLDDLAELCRNIVTEVTAAPFVEAGLDGAELGRALDAARTRRIAEAQ